MLQSPAETGLQQGIVDFSPSPFPRRVHRALRPLPLVGRRLTGGALIPRRFWSPWTSVEHFEHEVNQITAAAHKLARRVIWLEIARPAHYLVENYGDFSAVVRDFNAVLKAGSGVFVSLWNDGDASKFLLPDGHHLNVSGDDVP